MTIPMIWGLFSLMIFNLVDTYFISKLGTVPLAAIGFTFPIVMVVGGVSMGLGVAASSLISRAIGKGDHAEVQRLTVDSLLLAGCIVAVFAFIGLHTIRPLFTLLGAQEEVLSLISDYMRIWYFGTVFLVVPMIGNNAIRATGDTLLPGLIMCVGALTNAVLDPLFIFGFKLIPAMGIKGAALATVISRAITLCAALSILYFNKHMIRWKVLQWKELLSSWGRILYIGLPAAGSFIIVPTSMGIITRFVASFGHEAVAAFGVVIRIEGVVLAVLMALATVMGPFAGQNWGARKVERVARALKISFIFSLCWGVAAALLFIFKGKGIVSLFDVDPIVVRVAVMYLLIVPISYGMEGIIFILSSTFNALGKPLYSSALIITRVCLLYVPLAYFGKKLFGLGGIFAAALIANVIVGGWAYLGAKKIYHLLDA
ncbi:MAG: MATE family efflux transporter [Candidatus Omnitrophota bacterium]